VVPPKVASASKDEVSVRESTPQETGSENETFEPLDLDTMKSASKKPPLPTDMKAMRELANSSARSAIAKHSKRRYWESALSRLLIFVISTSVAALMMVTAESFTSPLFLGGLIPAFAGMHWGAKLLRDFLEAVRAGSEKESIPAEIMLEEGPLPIDGRAEPGPRDH